ncbi:MAG: aldehyde dehydrogenase family protein [Alphaproteobacteria bacterium]|nr:aldehyde dehydrogenase family protein [Alphaproteobacteria bacterium]
MRVSRAVRAGTVGINSHMRLSAEAETGSFGQSGLGRLHGLKGLYDVLETKHIYTAQGMI